MKQERGLTTANVIIYIIVIVIAISMLSVITSHFRTSITENLQKNDSNSKYIAFASYFVQDIQQEGNEVLEAKEIEEDDSKIYYIRFSNGNMYQFSEGNKTIYQNQTIICQDVDLCQFICQKQKDGKDKIIVYFASGDFQKVGDNGIEFYM